MQKRPIAAFAAAVLLQSIAAHAQAPAAALKLATAFGDHMVLQRDLPINVWGTAPAGTEVSVKIAQSSAKATADASGKWSAKLPPLAAGGPLTMTVQGGDATVTLSDVLVGEVWLCSGQSNMAWTLQNFKERSDPTIGNDIDAASDPMVRLGHVGHRVAFEPSSDTPIRWNPTTPENAAKFSATAYFFARSLQKQLGVPVGVVNASWGGTPAESWTDRETLDSDPAFKPALRRLETYPDQYPKLLAAWEKKVADLKKDPANPPMPLKPRAYDKNANLPATMWNGKLYPVVPMTFRGVVWYQGEADAARQQPTFYGKLLPAMFTGWRKAFGRGDDLRVLIVQLPMFGEDRIGLAGSHWAQLRDAQAKTAATLKNVELCVALDLGKPDNLHPPQKRQLGARLAAMAARTSPAALVKFARADFEASRCVLHFDNAGPRLVLNAPPGSTDFLLAGADKKWHVATAAREGDTVVVRSDAVPQPIAVRYAWSDSPSVSLTDTDGIPVAPFRSDDWPLLPDRGATKRPADEAADETP